MKLSKIIFCFLYFWSAVLFIFCAQARVGIFDPPDYFLPEEQKIVVVIPSYNNERWFERNLGSIFKQRNGGSPYENYEVIYIDDFSKDKTYERVKHFIKKQDQEHRTLLISNEENVGPLANIYKAVHMCDDDAIIILVDGDDWLAHDRVFAYINSTYTHQDVWLTYGSYREHPSARFGWASEPLPQWVIDANALRECHYYISHLRTFYAWLFKQIKKDDLLYEGKFFSMAGDIACMFPMFEMAGDHSKFIPEVLYVYNRDTPLNEDKINIALQMSLEREVRKRNKYKPLAKKP